MKVMKAFIAAAVLIAAAPAGAATVVTSDRVDGVPVIEKLDITDLPAGAVQRYYFRIGRMTSGQGWYIPVLVAKGTQPGKTLLLTAAVHGDELNGIGVIHRLFADLDPRRLSGTVIAVPGVNLPGLIAGTRNFPGGAGYDSADNLNRLMPGDRDGEAAERYAARLWDGLLRNPINAAIDLHTQSTGTAYPLYVFADMRVDGVRSLAQWISPDIVKVDKGVAGSMETTFDSRGIPAVTFEIGEAGRYQQDYIARATEGIRRVLAGMKIWPGPVAAPSNRPFTGNETGSLASDRGGIVTMLVRIGQAVSEGQNLAEVRDPLGRVVERITAPWDGRVLSVATEPLRAPGELVVRLIRWNPDAICAEGC